MAVVDHEAKWLFFCEPHTACRATNKALLKQFPSAVDVPPKHIKPEKLPFNPEGYKIVSAVRNPFEVLMTKKARPSSREWSLDKFFDLRWNHPTILACMRFCYFSKHIIWYEHLLEDLRHVFKHPTFELELEAKHCTPDKPKWYEYMTESQFNAFKYRSDITEYMQAFGYTINYDGTVIIDPDIRAKLCIPV
jgi:hypothetical protein